MARIKRYPLGEFMKRYSTEKQCREYLAGWRWESGYICPRCGSRHAYHLANGRYQCAECRHQVSVTAGTVLHKTHMPLTQWFLAFYFVCQDKRGISAVQLAAMLGPSGFIGCSKHCLEQPIIPLGPCSGASVPRWDSGIKPISCAV